MNHNKTISLCNAYGCGISRVHYPAGVALSILENA